MAVAYTLRPFQDANVFSRRRLGYQTEHAAEKAMEQLAAICTGIICDGVVNDVEAKYFRDWLCKFAPPAPTPTFTDIARRVGSIFKDGVVDDEERDELKTIMEELRGGPDPLKQYPAHWCVDHPLPPIVFPDKHFVVTGNFAFGKRTAVYAAIESRGGVAHDAMRFGIDYLVVGSVISKAWSEATYGNKIKAAVELRKQGGKPAIIPEPHWREHLELVTI
jgi:NAD-dependent DNA ligase